jgi:hypothetical protein
MNSRPLFIPVILGTVRKGRASENVAKFVFNQVKQRAKFGTSEGEANWSVTMQRGFARRNVATEQNGTRRFPEKGNRRLGQ